MYIYASLHKVYKPCRYTYEFRLLLHHISFFTSTSKKFFSVLHTLDVFSRILTIFTFGTRVYLFSL